MKQKLRYGFASRIIAVRLNGTCLEGEGFAPDIAVKTMPQDFEKDDPVVDTALQLLRRQK